MTNNHILNMAQAFAETDVNTATKPTKSGKGSGAPNAPNAPDSGIRECPIVFVCVPRPFWDFKLEYKGENDDEDEYYCAGSPAEKEWTETLKEARKTWLKPAAEFPGYTWTVYWICHYALHAILIPYNIAIFKGAKARKLIKKYDLQTQKRDQDSLGMFIYNDFTGYGLQEVIQNQLSAFNKESMSGKLSPFILWYMIEALEWWFNSTDTMLWNSMYTSFIDCSTSSSGHSDRRW
jgi:hypothetical protein